ncbi:MAG: hypothetical protein HC880_04540 [Bacteroidia bacterium]|nr:hypothetical protein [Bacteroidia bacterium]
MSQLLRLSGLISLSILLAMQACTTTDDTFTSKAWHNMNARYNSLFLAREAMKKAEKDMFDKRVENYNQVLDVIPTLDTTQLNAYDTQMEDVIKKSANIPNRHDNSRWLDPSYVLIGKARHYLRDYENAINTFKYVNTRGTEEDWRALALVELMQTYIYLRILNQPGLR